MESDIATGYIQKLSICYQSDREELLTKGAKATPTSLIGHSFTIEKLTVSLEKLESFETQRLLYANAYRSYIRCKRYYTRYGHHTALATMRKAYKNIHLLLLQKAQQTLLPSKL